MKIEVETKITILEGEEEGKVYTEKRIANTQPEYTIYGIVERFVFEWRYLRDEYILRRLNDNDRKR